jgi:hypothetical protein
MSTLATCIQQLQSLLRRLEWAGGDDWGAACPDCQAYRDPNRKHTTNCELAAVLDRVEQQKGGAT